MNSPVWVLAQASGDPAPEEPRTAQRHRRYHTRLFFASLADSKMLRAVHHDAASAGFALASEPTDSAQAELLALFDRFAETRDELVQLTRCLCPACRDVAGRSLRVVAHASPTADFSLMRRVLESPMPADEYLVLTEAAVEAIGEPQSTLFEPLDCPVPCRVGMFVTPEIAPLQVGWWARFGHSLRLGTTGWLGR